MTGTLVPWTVRSRIVVVGVTEAVNAAFLGERKPTPAEAHALWKAANDALQDAFERHLRKNYPSPSATTYEHWISGANNVAICLSDKQPEPSTPLYKP